MSALRQIASVTLMNIKSIPKRLGASSVIVIGIAGVVGVLVSILALVAGLSQMMAGSGRADRAIVVSTGASYETLSNLTREAVQTIADAPAIKHASDGSPRVSADALAIVRLPLIRDGSSSNVSLRGVSRAALDVRPEIRLAEGRMFKRAVRELMVGRTLQRQFRGLEVGSRVLLRGADWTVVGAFESHGDPHEAEMITGAEVLQASFERSTFQSVTVLLDSAAAFAQFKAAIAGNPSLAVDVMREADYLQQQSQAFSRLLSFLAYLIGGIMAIGAVFGALNAMYSAVSTRTVEIATLRVLGFGASAVVVSVFAEALLLALLGGVAGGLLAWLMFSGHAVRTSGGGLTQLSVPLAVDLSLIGFGVLWACIIGMVGASFPAIRAARAPLASALRGT
ncbi:MAG TPA: ABC transporter permease [Steroidobacteraceae bacterium]|jgi:putative ABC transport system permease protein